MLFLIKEHQDYVSGPSQKLMAKKKDVCKITKQVVWKEGTITDYKNIYQYNIPNYIPVISIFEDDTSEITLEISSYKANNIRKIFSYNSIEKNPTDNRCDSDAKKSFKNKIKKLENAGYMYI